MTYLRADGNPIKSICRSRIIQITLISWVGLVCSSFPALHIQQGIPMIPGQNGAEAVMKSCYKPGNSEYLERVLGLFENRPSGHLILMYPRDYVSRMGSVNLNSVEEDILEYLGEIGAEDQFRPHMRDLVSVFLMWMYHFGRGDLDDKGRLKQVLRKTPKPMTNYFAQISNVSLAGFKLSHFPAGALGLIFFNAASVDLSRTRLKRGFKDLSILSDLTYLSLNDNELTEFPFELLESGGFGSLVFLFLYGNHIEELKFKDCDEMHPLNIVYLNLGCNAIKAVENVATALPKLHTVFIDHTLADKCEKGWFKGYRTSVSIAYVLN